MKCVRFERPAPVRTLVKICRWHKSAPSKDGALKYLQVSFVDQDMNIVQLLLGNSGGSVHHQVLCVLVVVRWAAALLTPCRTG